MSADTARIRLEPWSIEIDAPLGAPLQPLLSAQAVEFPCGGTGVCGGCAVRVHSGSLAVTAADESAFSAQEIAAGWRLACQARAEMPLVLECGQSRMDILTDDLQLRPSGKRGLGIAIDLGTTTIAAQLIDLAAGNVLAVRTALNPQARFGADVMTRIREALAGEDLAAPIRAELAGIVAQLAHGREPEIAQVILVGNTVMHHLFCGLDVEPLAHTPFASPRLGAQRFAPSDLGWTLPASCSVEFAPCIGGFVGSDILAGIVATGMARNDRLAALIDLGTNGEIVIGNRHGIVCASTAAGPAFEAASIRMGMRAAPGAIAHLHSRRGTMLATVIGGADPRGICGSGLVDAVAEGLANRAILPSGRIVDPSRTFPVAGPVVLFQPDIRQLQLAKGAIASGFRLLLRRLGAAPADLESIHLAGAFGNYVRIDSALRIGLLDAPAPVIHAAGNTALRGAKMLLLSPAALALPALAHISLAAIPQFQDEFAASMTFPASAETGS